MPGVGESSSILCQKATMQTNIQAKKKLRFLLCRLKKSGPRLRPVNGNFTRILGIFILSNSKKWVKIQNIWVMDGRWVEGLSWMWVIFHPIRHPIHHSIVCPLFVISLLFVFCHLNFTRFLIGYIVNFIIFVKINMLNKIFIGSLYLKYLF